MNRCCFENTRKLTVRAWLVYCVVACVVALILPAMAHGEVKKVSGKGEQKFVATSKKREADEKRTLLAQLEEQARKDAVSVALIHIYGNKSRFGDKYDAVLDAAYKQSSMFVRDSEIVNAGFVGDIATVEVSLGIDDAALREFVKDTFELSVAGDVENAFNIYVLAFTVEGMDPDRAAPQLLREEINDDRNNVHSSSIAVDAKDIESASNSAKSSSGASIKLKAGQESSDVAASTDRQSIKASQSASVDANGSARSESNFANASVSAAQNSKVDAHSDSANFAASQSKSSIDLDASKNRASASSSAHFSDTSVKSAEATASDTSSSYHSLRVYADTTKKGAGQTNEIRTKLGELLKVNGFATKNSTINLQSQEFKNEDELNAAVLEELRHSPDFEPKDFVALALNRLTPVADGKGYTAAVTYRISRISDGTILFEQSATGDSGPASSDDVARALATELAIKRAEPIFTSQLAPAIRQLQRTDTKKADKRALQYEIRIKGLASPRLTMPMQEALRAAGFDLTATFRNGLQVLTVQLAGRNSSQIDGIIDPFLASYDFVSQDESVTELKVK
jgi:hypothetical protein